MKTEAEAAGKAEVEGKATTAMAGEEETHTAPAGVDMHIVEEDVAMASTPPAQLSPPLVAVPGDTVTSTPTSAASYPVRESQETAPTTASYIPRTSSLASRPHSSPAALLDVPSSPVTPRRSGQPSPPPLKHRRRDSSKDEDDDADLVARPSEKRGCGNAQRLPAVRVMWQ